MGLAGALLVVGANGDGAVEFRERVAASDWQLRLRRVPGSAAGLPAYGTSLAIDGTNVIVGAAELGGATDPGAVETIDITDL